MEQKREVANLRTDVLGKAKEGLGRGLGQLRRKRGFIAARFTVFADGLGLKTWGKQDRRSNAFVVVCQFDN